MTLRRLLVAGSLLVCAAGCGGAPEADGGGSAVRADTVSRPVPSLTEVANEPSRSASAQVAPEVAPSGDLWFTVRDYARREERTIRFDRSAGAFRGEGDEHRRVEDLLRSFAGLLHDQEVTRGFARRVALGAQPVPGFPRLGEPDATDHFVERIPDSPRVRVHRDEVGMVVAVQVFASEGSVPAAVLRVTSWAPLAGKQIPTGFASTSGLEIEVFDLQLR